MSHTPHTQIRDAQLGQGQGEDVRLCPTKPAKPSPEGIIKLILLAWQRLLPGRSQGSVQLLQGQSSEQRLWALSILPAPEEASSTGCPSPGSSGAEAAEQGEEQDLCSSLIPLGQCTL